MGSSEAPADLPKGDSPTLDLLHPTYKEKVIQWKKNGPSWKGALSMEAYLRREDFLCDQELSRDGGITHWVLVDTTTPEMDRIVLSGCETLRKKALVARDGKVQDVVSHGIGSVFCPPELRRRGYAQRMMKELGKKLKTWQTEQQPCLFTVLWSDIGKQFYASHGWEPFNSTHISIPAITSTRGFLSSLPKPRSLYADDLEELCAIDEKLIRAQMKSMAKDSKTAVAIVPDIETIRWHHAREEFVGNELHGQKPQVKGAIVGEPGHRIWCYWTRMWYNPDPTASKDNTLHILRLVVEDGSLSSFPEHPATHGARNGDTASRDKVAIAALFSMAQEQAREWKMAEVEAWNPSETTVQAAKMLDPKAAVVERDQESISSLMWYGDDVKAPVAEAIDWIGNEKYGWC